mmetsp:Transcript_119584/g.332560  ORF Transcript_119584/g.332560 Transcript_119584/m.332560 type:complete len:210 (-) Transcript_119584:20-649(-)
MYSVPVTALQPPRSSPVTLGLRPTSVPVTVLPAMVSTVPTLGGASRPAGWPKSVALKYWLPVSWREAPGSLPVTLTERPTSTPETACPPCDDMTLTLRGPGRGTASQTVCCCSRDRYSVPVTVRHDPASSPVTWAERPTSVPVTFCSRKVLLTATLAGPGAGRVPHTELNCSRLKYSVPVTLLQTPASLPVTLRLLSTGVPVTDRPDSV